MSVIEKAKSLQLQGIEDEGLPQPTRLLEMPCGTLIAYGGEQGTITAQKEGEFYVLHQFLDMIRAVAVSPDGKRVVIGDDYGSTKVYPFDDYTGQGVHPFCRALYRQTNTNEDDLMSQDFSSDPMESFLGPQLGVPIRDLKFVKDYIVAIASESGLVLVNVESSSTLLERGLEHEVEEHHASSGIRGVALFKNYMATLAMDGRLCLWDTEKRALVERESTKCIHKVDVGEIHGADGFDRSCRPVFLQLSDTESILATPGLLLPTVRWLADNKLNSMELENTKPHEGHIESIVAIQFLNPTDDARYYVTSGRDARVVLWKWNDGNKVTPLKTFTLSSAATDFLLQGSQLLAASADGTYATINLTPYVPSSALPSPKVGTKTPPAAISSAAKNMKPFNSHIDANRNDDDDSDVAFHESSSSTKNRVRFVDDEAEVDEDEDGGRNDTVGEDEPNKVGVAKSSFDDVDDDDADSFHGPHSSMKAADNVDDAADLDEDIGHYQPISSVTAMQRAPSVPPQAAFSPSSTPLDLSRRFLCWNHMGALTLLQGDDRNTVDITFTDSAYKRPISFTDNMNFILGSLGEDGGIFATDLQLDDEEGSLDGLDDLNMSEATKRAVRKSQNKDGRSKATGSTIFFYRFTSIGSLREKDWYLNLPVGERVWGAATGEGWVAVATSRKYLRFFSTGGNQGHIFWLKSDPVTMAGRGRFMAVVYHDNLPLEDGTQRLGYQLWDAPSCEVLSDGPLSCLNKGASLTWLGFSNDMSLMAMDSDGMLSMLVQTGSNRWEWVPILDTMGLRKSMDDQFWPITVFDGKMVCVPLKGGNLYPDAARKPVTSTLGLRLPLAASNIGKT
jgi:Minichromosome loss protein, Mcl1, middle region